MKQVFFDTSGMIASLNEDDRHHEEATDIMQRFQPSTILVTADYVLTEFLNSFSKVPLRRKAYELLVWIEDSSSVIMERINRKRYDDALKLYQAYTDKDWSFTDCTSFIVMRELEIREAFTNDKHFEQAGFTRLIV